MRSDEHVQAYDVLFGFEVAKDENVLHRIMICM